MGPHPLAASASLCSAPLFISPLPLGSASETQSLAEPRETLACGFIAQFMPPFINVHLGALWACSRELFAASGRDVFIRIGELHEHRSAQFRHPANWIDG